MIANNYCELGLEDESDCCSCFQLHSRFLCLLKDLDRNDHPDIIAVTMRTATQSLSLWQDHLSCRTCWNNQDNSILSLWVISIETVVKCLWRSVLEHQKQQNDQLSQKSLDSSKSLFSGRGTEVTSSIGSVAGLGPRAVSNYMESGHKLLDAAATYMNSPTRIKVGDFQVPEEEQMFVMGMLIVRVLGRMKEAVRDSRNRTKQNRQGDTNKEHNCHAQDRIISLMLNNLEISIQELEQRLKPFMTR